MKYIAVSSSSPVSHIIPPIIGGIKASEEEHKRRIEEQIREFDQRMEEQDEYEQEVEGEIKKNSIPSKAIMPFYATTCPAGWLMANGENGTPDLR